jgi:glycosyltransferase involved in cell wall biosynthesis
MRIGYLINEYPAVSLSFIRREILALEADGVSVTRISLRPARDELVLEVDALERRRTRPVLAAGAVRIAAAVLGKAARSPVRFARALALAVRIGWRSDRGLPRHLAYLAEACLVERWLRAAGVQHLHAHFGTNPAAVAMLCHALGGPTYSFTVHGPEEFDKPTFLALGEKIRRAAFVVGVSSFGRSQLCRWARHEDWPKLQVVRCGVGPDLLCAPQRPIPSEARFVCIARLSEQKGHPILIEAAARLAREGYAFEIVLAGDGPLRTQLEALVRRWGLERHVRFEGWVDAARVREAILDSRAVVQPSFAEGLPVVLMEAFALGRPVITTTVAGIPELVEPGVNGWLVPAGSVDALADAMRDVLRAVPARLTEMGQAGAALVAWRHDVAREARTLAGLFRRTIESPGNEPSADGWAPSPELPARPTASARREGRA